MIDINQIERLINLLGVIVSVALAAGWLWRKAKKPLLDLEECKDRLTKLEHGQEVILEMLSRVALHIRPRQAPRE